MRPGICIHPGIRSIDTGSAISVSDGKPGIAISRVRIRWGIVGAEHEKSIKKTVAPSGVNPIYEMVE